MATLGDLLREWPGSGKLQDPWSGHYDLAIPRFPGFAGHFKITDSGEIVYAVEGAGKKPLKLHLAENTPQDALARALHWLDQNNARNEVRDSEGYTGPIDLVTASPQDSGRRRVHGMPAVPVGTMM